jgi:hypothetical protein
MSASNERKVISAIAVIFLIAGMSQPCATAEASTKPAAQNQESGGANQQDPFADLAKLQSCRRPLLPLPATAFNGTARGVRHDSRSISRA